MVISAQQRRLTAFDQWSVARTQKLLGGLEQLVNQQDPTLGALGAILQSLGAPAMVIGGIAVISHGYARTTADRDVLVSRDDALRLTVALETSPDWQRLESKEFSFLHLPTNGQIDVVTSGDLAATGLIPYYFPLPGELAGHGQLAGLPIVGLNDLIYLKLLAGRMRDHADIMELCKLHMNTIDFESILGRLDPSDEERREKLAEIRKQAPKELQTERQRNRGLRDERDKPTDTNE